MMRCVIDASVAASAFFREETSLMARALLTSGCEMFAPDLIYPEVGNVIWKRQRRNEIDEEEACALLSDVLVLPLNITPSSQLVESALKLALRTNRTVYDCLYLALAVQSKSIMVTGDKRFVNALADTPLEKYVSWIGHIR